MHINTHKLPYYGVNCIKMTEVWMTTIFCLNFILETSFYEDPVLIP
jgi:hypothetical protein